ncbi:histidine kinase [Nonomuraea fuscirosea]|uniref:histidine kinase n=1 Tax=Nonomuraea fuscirosea TaxID=1291556 RepID=UPI0037B6CAF0
MVSSSARRLSSALITAVSCAYTVIALVYFLQGPLYGVLALVVFLVVVGVHYLNMRAGLRGGRPPAFPLTVLLQVVATYLPDFLLPGGMSALTTPLLAGTLLVHLPLRWGGAGVGLIMLYEGTQLWFGPHAAHLTLFYVVTVPTTGTMIYALVRFTRVTAELEQARAELADAAVLKERVRISRDLHDGLGRSLTAIALKGDLAGRLIDRDPGTARAEVGELVQVAREAAQDVRQVARDYRAMSLAGEVDRAVALLESSGVSVQAHLADVTLPTRSEEALAWAVREGVTNVLRHSRATTCTITTSLQEGAVRLELANDGAPPDSGTDPDPDPDSSPASGAGSVSSAGAGFGTGAPGAGLVSLAERAAQAGGTATGSRTGQGGFVLAMEVAVRREAVS